MQSLLDKNLADIDEWQTEMQLKPMRVGKIKLYAPMLAEDVVSFTGVEMIDDVNTAITQSLSQQGSAEIAVIPEGPYVVPFAAA